MKKQNTQLLKEVIEQIIQTEKMGGERLKDKLPEIRLLNSWDEMLGLTVARVTRNKYIYNRKLFVQLNSSIVRQQLWMLRSEIIEKLNSRAGAKVIDELILQ